MENYLRIKFIEFIVRCCFIGIATPIIQIAGSIRRHFSVLYQKMAQEEVNVWNENRWQHSQSKFPPVYQYHVNKSGSYNPD